ncbi:ABC transporter permease [[Mycoplasma] gypis]|uniref:ABC transporter permease n=1 Tax=[Mycoplasma] gypis TaxID=92404 RepID=A0ABZ2RQG1_9BACT|nr:ABC transporter permease [[Mycoplasma] gypis]MBN0919530.1 ABC transporter permease [[Mycoplasma] gypis]
MINLLKEVFKSLSKNKVTVIGLTILVFITCGLFTLLFDVKKSYTSTLNEFQKVSKIQDLTVDLDVNPTGEAPNGGYDQVNEEGQKTNKQSVYIPTNTKKFHTVDKYLSTPVKYLNYIPLNEITNDSSLTNSYIDSELFQTWFLNSQKNLGNVIFDLNDASIQFLEDETINIWTKQNDSFIKKTNNFQIVPTTHFRFVKDYALKDFAKVYNTPNPQDSKANDFIISPSDLFINPSTKEATFEVGIYNAWKKEGDVLTISGEEVAKMLGFELVNDRYEFKNSPKDFSYQNPELVSNKNIDPNSRINLQFSLENYFRENNITEINARQNEKFVFSKNTKYHFPINWVQFTEREINFFRYSFILNWDKNVNENYSNWRGTYHEFIKSVYQNNGNQIPGDLENANYWIKSTKERKWTGGNKPGDFNQYNDKISEDDLDVTFATKNDEPTSLSKNTIRKIDHYSDSWNTQEKIKWFNNISNTNLLQEKRNYISNKANNITQNKIIQLIKDSVGEENVGLRQTLTVETINNKDNNKNTFHFINTGDKENILQGVKQNVGALYNEHYNPTILNSAIEPQNIDDYLLVYDENYPDRIYKLPPVYAANIVKYIYQNYTPHPKYLDVDIRFENYYDYYEGTQIPFEKSAKIVTLTSAKNNDFFVQYGLTSTHDKKTNTEKYIILNRQEIDGVTKWVKLILKDQDSSLTEEQLSKFLIEHNLTLNARIGKSGWAKVDKIYKNKISLPLLFGTIDSSAVLDITQNNSIGLLISQIKQAANNSQLSEILTEDQLDRILLSGQLAVEKNNFQAFLAAGKTNDRIAKKVLFEFLYNLTQPLQSSKMKIINSNGNAFVYSILTNIINHIRSAYNSQPTPEKKLEYIKSEMYYLEKFFMFITGTKQGIFESIITGFGLQNIVDYIVDFNKFLDSIIQIFTSIDFIKFSSMINNWYAKYPYKAYGNPNDNYYELSRSETLFYLVKSINENKLKIGLKNLISNINFERFLNPDSQYSLYSFVLRAHELSGNDLSTENKNSLKSLLNKFNAYKNQPAEKYQNIKEGLKSIIDLISLDTFSRAMEHFLNKNIKKETLNISGVLFENNYSKYLNNSEMVTALIASIAQEYNNEDKQIPNKLKQLKEAIITLGNLSSATSSIAGLNIPASDENKFSINDIAAFDLIRFPEVKKDDLSFKIINKYDLNKIEDLQNKIQNAVNSGKNFIKFSIEEANFLKEIALVSNEEFSNLQAILDKINRYLAIVKKLDLSSYGKEANAYKIDFKDNPLKPVKTIGDIAYRSALLNTQSDTQYKEVYKFLYNQISPILLQMMQHNLNGIVSQDMQMFALWIQIAYELKNNNKDIKLEQIQTILTKLFDFINQKQVKDLVTNYSKVLNPIPSFNSLLGSDEQNYSTILKIAYGLTDNVAMAKMLKEFDFINKFLSTLNTEYNESIKSILNKNIFLLAKFVALINSSDIFPTFFLESQSMFLNNFIKSDLNQITPLISDEYDLDIVYKNYLEETKLSKILSLVGLNSSIMSPFTILSFPQILIWAGISDKENNGNLAYIISNIPNSLETISFDDLNQKIIPLFDKLENKKIIKETVADKNINLDVSYLNWIKNHIIAFNGEDSILFGINIKKTYEKIFYAVTNEKEVTDLISYTDSASYLAKVNYAYLQKNKKEIYTGDISKYLSNPFLMASFVANLDSKYKVTINSIEYVIIGQETTADYLYPVINEENLQVDTKRQALVYVNTNGFDRMRSAYPTFAIKNYLLVKSNPNKSMQVMQNGKLVSKKQTPELLKEDLSNKIATYANNYIPKVYLAAELDPINPERSIRITLVQSIIKAISNVQTFSVIILISLVLLSVYFIIRRYINIRNKVIGILRSQGYRSVEIAFAFSSFCWMSTFIGGLSGYIIGHFAQGFTFEIFSSYWTLPTNIISFNWMTLFITILVPIIATSMLIFVITLMSMRLKPVEMMSGLSDLQIGGFAQKIAVLFRRLPIKSRFVATLTLNNFWKLFSLFISFAITSLITMFSLSSLNVFSKSIQRTYQNRDYKYKMDLETPTTEGGPYVLFDKNNIDNLLYMPDDLSASSSATTKNQTDYNSPFYFKPGYVYNTDVINKPYAPAVLTKSSLDVTLDTSVKLSPWDVVFASLPETQKARVIEIFKNVSTDMMLSQNLWYEPTQKRATAEQSKQELDNFFATKDNDINSEKTSFFWFTSNAPSGTGIQTSSSSGQFYYVEWDKENNYYKKPAIIKTNTVRQKYREFLIDAYKQIKTNDFFMSFGGVVWNDSTNEKYSYAKSFFKNESINVYGYKNNSKFVSLRNAKNKDLNQLLIDKSKDINIESDDLNKTKLPILINELSAKKFNLQIGSVISLPVLNHIDRFVNKVLNKEAPNNTYTFEVVGINNTFINTEFITTKEIVDKITGLDKLTYALKEARMPELKVLLDNNHANEKEVVEWFNNNYEAFNGIFSNDSAPVQTISTLTTYSSSGYWGAIQSFDANNSDEKSLTDFYQKIFVGQLSTKPMFYETVKSYNDIHNITPKDPTQKQQFYEDLYARVRNKIVPEFLGLQENDLSYIDWGKEAIQSKPIADSEIKKKMVQAINKMYGVNGDSIYGKDILYAASNNVDSKDIEAGFINEIAKTITSITLAFIVISFIVSIIILIMITKSMVASNEESIATFSILGYTNKEKLFLFFFNYIPIILLASLLMIPVTLGLIASFNAFLIATSQMVLPLTLYQSTIMLSMIVSLLVFSITSIFAWISLNKIKPIYLLKGK